MRHGRTAVATAVETAAALVASLPAGAPRGRLRDPLVLVLVLPPLAAALDVLGWSAAVARAVSRVGDPLRRAIGTCLIWLAVSAS
ncbi:MAG TPA: hypothetical protein VF763_08840 [Candidatus Limnocylindrales bacterium]